MLSLPVTRSQDPGQSQLVTDGEQCALPVRRDRDPHHQREPRAAEPRRDKLAVAIGEIGPHQGPRHDHRMAQESPQSHRGLRGCGPVRRGSQSNDAPVELLPRVVGGVGDDRPAGELAAVGRMQIAGGQARELRSGPGRRPAGSRLSGARSDRRLRRRPHPASPLPPSQRVGDRGRRPGWCARGGRAIWRAGNTSMARLGMVPTVMAADAAAAQLRSNTRKVPRMRPASTAISWAAAVGRAPVVSRSNKRRHTFSRGRPGAGWLMAG